LERKDKRSNHKKSGRGLIQLASAIGVVAADGIIYSIFKLPDADVRSSNAPNFFSLFHGCELADCRP
jgi:hypothetical protein